MTKLYVTIGAIFCFNFLLAFHSHADTTLFPIDTFGVAGPIPTPGNIADLEGAPSAGTAVRFDPGDLGFLMFDQELTGLTTGVENLGIQFNITDFVPAASTGRAFVSVLLGNITFNPTSFQLAPTAGLTTPDGDASLFQFTEVGSTGIFTVDTTAFAAGCQAIGGCNTIVIGTSGLGAAGGGSFLDGGTLTFSSVIATSPEPDVWAFMIMGFFAIAMQLKARRQRLLRGGSRSYAPAMAA